MITPDQQQKLDQLTQHAGFTPAPQTNNAWAAFDQLTKNHSQEQPTSQPNIFQRTLGDMGDQLKGGIKNVGHVAHNVVQDVGQAGQDIGQGFNDAMSGKQDATQAGFQAVGHLAKAAMSPITETASAATQDTGNELSNIPSFQNMANSKVGDALAKANIPGDVYAKWAQAHPDAAKNLEALGNIAQVGTAIPAGGEVGGIAKTGLDTVADTAKAGAGKVADAAGAVGDAAGKVKDAVGDKIQDKYVQQTHDDWAKPTTVTKPAYNKATEIFNNAKANNHDIADTLVKNKIKLSDNIDNGTYSTSDTADKMRADAGTLSNDLLRPSLRKADLTVPKTPVGDVINAARKTLAANKYITSETKDAILKQLDKTELSLTKKFKDGMSLENLQDEKIVRDANAKYSPVGDIATNAEAIKNKAIADSARKLVEDKAPEDVPVHEFNAELTKQHQAADYLDALNGKKAPVSLKSRVAKTAAKVAGAAAGNAVGGGILGTVGGYHLGGMLESMVENMPNPIKNHFLDNLKVSNPEAFQKVQDYLNK